tara:strand:- start:23 stop:307 length:285 start_codon:yes stop_codon:yes gene_type:complete
MFGQLMTEKDKHLHFLSGVIVSQLTYSVVYIKTKNKKKAFLYSISSSVIVGILKELSDNRQPNNRFDSKDLLATTYGGITMGITLNLIIKKKGK